MEIKNLQNEILNCKNEVEQWKAAASEMVNSEQMIKLSKQVDEIKF